MGWADLREGRQPVQWSFVSDQDLGKRRGSASTSHSPRTPRGLSAAAACREPLSPPLARPTCDFAAAAALALAPARQPGSVSNSASNSTSPSAEGAPFGRRKGLGLGVSEALVSSRSSLVSASSPGTSLEGQQRSQSSAAAVSKLLLQQHEGAAKLRPEEVVPPSQLRRKHGFGRTPFFQQHQMQASTPYEQVCKQQGILPKFAAAVRECLRVCPEEASLKGLGLGDRQLAALLQDTSLLPTGEIQRWRLGDDRLTGKGIATLSEALAPCTTLVHVARNEMGLYGAQALARAIENNKLQQLRFLEVSGTGMGNDAISHLANALVNGCPVLLRLEASRNHFSEGEALGKLAARHTQLTRLGLSHNQLCGHAGAALFKGVLANGSASQQLADLDVAWNAIGNNGAKAGAEAIAQALRESTTLFHLDLSYNSMDEAACAIIGAGLRDNHYLYGLHMVGNAAIINPDGFLVPRSQGRDPSPAQEYPDCMGLLPAVISSNKKDRPEALKCLGDAPASRPTTAPSSDGVSSGQSSIDAEEMWYPDSCLAIPSPPPSQPQQSLADLHPRRKQFGMPRSRPSSSSGQRSMTGYSMPRRCRGTQPWTVDALLRERDLLEQRTTCWACEGWERVEVEWEVPSKDEMPRAVWAFLSFDDFSSALRLRVQPGARKFVGARMVPPGCEMRVIFQVDSALRLPPAMKTEVLGTPIAIELRACPDCLPHLDPPSDQDVVLHETQKKKPDILEHRFVLAVSTVGIVSATGRATAHSMPVSCVGKPQRVVLLGDEASGSTVQMPRVTEIEYRMQTHIPPTKSPLTSWRRDNAAVLEDCLRLDWRRAKVTRVVPAEEHDAVYKVLEKGYGKVVSLYRRLSSISASEAAGFYVGPLEVSDMMVSSTIIDGERTRRSDVDRFVIASQVVFSDEKHGGGCEGIISYGLVRHQFLELILRVAQHFLSVKIEPTWEKAVSRLLNLLAPHSQKDIAETDAFIDALHSEASDAVFKKYWHALSTVFNRFTSRQAGAKVKHLTMSEFASTLEALHAYDSRFHQRHTALAFRLGMATQAEETTSNRFKEMSFTEFCHSMGVIVSMRSGFDKNQLADQLERFLSAALPLRG